MKRLLNHIGHFIRILRNRDLAGIREWSLFDGLPASGATERLQASFPELSRILVQLFLLVVLEICFRHLDDVIFGDFSSFRHDGGCICPTERAKSVLALEIGQPNPSVRHTTRENLLSSCSGECPGAVRAACQPI